MISSIYCLPRPVGLFKKGLGTFLQEQCDQQAWRAVPGDLKGLKFEEQLEVIRQNLLDLHWYESSPMVANSYRAYPRLHTLIDMASYPGHLFLLSPIAGAAQTQKLFSGRLRPSVCLNSFKKEAFLVPRSLRVVVGQLDWQSVPERCGDLCTELNGRLDGVPDGNQVIDPGLVQAFWQSEG